MSLHICIAGHIATADVAPYLEEKGKGLPVGYDGAPLTGVLIGELLALGHEVTGITIDYRLGHAASAVTACGPGFTFIVLPGRRRAWRFNGRFPGRALDLFRRERRIVASAIQTVAPDVVHSHWAYEFSLGALDSGVPHLLTCHDSPAAVLKFTRSPYRAMRYLMAREALGKARCVSAVSSYMAQAVRGLVHVPVHVVPNPLAPYVVDRGRIRQRPATRRIAMICNGWDRRKNPEPALHAFAQFRALNRQAELHLFGADFGIGERAQQWAVHNGLGGGMVFRGSLPHRELIAELEGLDLLLHPSLEESFGVVLAEAMALGLPIVAGAASGAVPWVVGADGNGVSECAVLANVQSADDIADAITRAFDGDYAARSKSGHKRARTHYEPRAVAYAYERLYALVLGAQGSVDVRALKSTSPAEQSE